MNPVLRPVTQQALGAFRVRRRRLLWLRAVMSLIITLLGGWLVVALLDRAWLLPEAVRPWAALGVVIAACWLAWQVAGRWFGAVRDEEDAARLLESMVPALRERLLAAVELSRGHEQDSLEFRERLQEEVATELKQLDVSRVLPLSVLKFWWRVMGALLVLIIALTCIPSLHLPGFLARAAVPFVDLPRPSTVKITILEPAPVSTLVPVASEQNVRVEVYGLKTDEVWLESRSEEGRLRRAPMQLVGDLRYEAALTVGQTDIEYRVRAGDALTSWHRLSVRSRPRVVEFAKTFVPPAYTGLPETSLTDAQGDLEVLEDSTIRLSLQVNQPVAKAELLLNPDEADHPEAIEAAIGDDGRIRVEWKAQVGLESWRLALTSRETGFTNEESSSWRVSLIPDMPPVVQMTEPQEQQALQADESVRVRGVVSDDLGLAKVALAHSVNGTNWVEVEQPLQPGRESAVQAVLPLAPLQVQPGDAVLFKLVATDSKGQRTESSVARVILLERTVDPHLRHWADEGRRLAVQASRLGEQTRELRKAMDALMKAASGKGQTLPTSELARAQTELQQTRERAEDLWLQLQQAAPSAPSATDAREAQWLGERLTRLRRQGLARLQKYLQQGTVGREKVRQTLSEATSDAETLARATRVFAAEDNTRLAEQGTRQLSRQEALLTEQSLSANRNAQSRPIWQEQQRAALVASTALDRELDTLRAVLESGGQRLIQDWRQQLADTAEDLKASLDREGHTKSPEHLYGASDNHRQRLARAADQLRTLAEQAAEQAAKMREQLGRTENPALAALSDANNALAQAAAQARTPNKPQRLDHEQLTASQRAERALNEASRQLEDQAALHGRLPMQDQTAALDLNRASRAAGRLAAASAETQPEKIAQVKQESEQLTQAARLLEVEAMAQLAKHASAEATKEDSANPWEASSAQSRTAAEALNQVPNRLKRLKNVGSDLAEAARLAGEAQQRAAEQARAMERLRAQQPDLEVDEQPTRQLLKDAAQRAMEVADQLAAPAAEARAQLAQLAPQVSEMMKAMAQDLKKARQATTAAAEQAAQEGKVEQVAEQARELQELADEDARKMESLQAALRQEANAADLRQANQRQMARAADVALAQMQQKVPQIAENLKQAAQASQSSVQEESLRKAAQTQEQAEQGLDQLAESLAKLEQDQPISDAELAAMSDMEKDLGVDKELEEAYRRAQELARMAQDASQDPRAVLAELEKELPTNAVMRKALAELSKQTAQASEQAVSQEAMLPSNIGLATEQAAHDLARAARHQQRLGQEEAARQSAQVSQQLQQQARAAKGQPGQAQKPIGPEAQAAAAQAAKAIETATLATPAVAADFFEQMQGALLAQALDQLDQTLNPRMGDGGPSQPGEGKESAGSQEQAREALDQARQSQQQSMASQRSQGQTPGSSAVAQQAQKNPSSESNTASAGESGNQSQQVMVEALPTPSAMSGGDWGHLPSKMAADLSEATRGEAPPEYRAAIESYYKAIATQAKR